MAIATIGPFQMLRSLCVIDTNFTILRHFLIKLWRNETLRYFIRTLYNAPCIICSNYVIDWPVSVVARSKARVCGRSLAGIVVSNPVQWHRWLSILSVVCCQVEVYDCLITRTEESHRLRRIWMWFRNLKKEMAIVRFGPRRNRKNEMLLIGRKISSFDWWLCLGVWR
jgi:hypothetical protein